MNPLKIAIVGGGPSSFYVASRLLSWIPANSSQQLRIHIYDRLWAPYGLVRYGVAPDHPEVKNCTHKFDTAASDPRLQFFGNVNVGTQQTNIPHTISLPMSSIMSNYTHLVIGTGCTVPIMHPKILPSEHCIPALNVVHWYTQHPSRPSPPPLDKTRHVSIIGQGNVSLDIARMLLSRPSDLVKYDVPDPVLDLLSRSKVEHISVIGRRGPFEAAFTAKEVREMMNLPGAAMIPIDENTLEVPEASVTRQQSRIVSLLKKGSRNKATNPSHCFKTWSMEFFRSPTGISPSPTSSSWIELTLAHTMLDQNARAVPTGQTSTLPTDLVITSLGHRPETTSDWYDPSSGHVRNVSGRVIDEAGNTLQNVYASGWAATGAKGVLASTMLNAYALAETILSDAKGSLSTTTLLQDEPEQVTRQVMKGASSGLDELPKEVIKGQQDRIVTSHEDWKRIDEEELRRGLQDRNGKERERMGWEQARQFLMHRKY